MKFFFVLCAVFILTLDTAVKYFIEKFFFGNSEIIPNILTLTCVRNNGGAFGVLQNGKFVFIFFAILAIFYFVYIIFSEEHLNNLFIMSSSLIVGGGMSNLLDRIFRGYVVDYIQLSFFPPAFNLSDFCICAGCILLSVHTLFSGSLPKDG